MPQSTRQQRREEREAQEAREGRGLLKSIPIAAWLGVGGALIVVAVLVIVLSSGSGSSSSTEFTGTAYPGVDTANARFVSGPIDSSNANSLEVAWSLPLSAKSTYGAYSATPVISNGVIYSQDLESNVQAIDLESGEVLWTKNYEDPDQGPNGVVVAGGMVFGATSSTAFGLDQESGEEVWSVPLTRGANEGIDMPPGYREGLVYVSTVPTIANSEYPGGGVGVLWALDAKTGRKVWHFNTVPNDLWSKKNAQINSGGGLWYAPSFDEKGAMYFGTGNPTPYPGTAQFPWGSSRPGPNLYTDSMVKLDAKTGKMKWYYQLTPHDVYDWDFQDPPILTSAGGRPVAIGAGKSGIVVALDAETGKPVWKQPVGIHNGHDADGVLAMNGETSKLKGGTVYPGTLGGVIAPMAANETTVFVPVVNHPLSVQSGAEIGESPELSGELAALDIKTGKVMWTKKYPTAAFGAPTAVNDMVFIATFDGTVHGLSAKSGGEVWQASLPAGSNTGLMASGDTLVVPAGIPTEEGQAAEMVAYRLASGG
jgi:outer membrane protein assembly factor BamB